MKNFKKILVMFLVLALLFGCGKSSDGDKEAKGDDEVVELLMYQVGDAPDHFEAIMDKVNEIAEEEIGVRVDLQYIGWGEWGDKMSVIVSSGEYYDLSLAQNFVINAQKGAYADLTDLAEEYAKDYFDNLDDAYIKGNTFDGKLYGFPVNANVFAQQMLTFNKELLDKHDLSIEDVNGYEDIEPLLKVIKENEPETTPFAIGRGYRAALGNFDYILGDSFPLAVDIDGDHDKIVNVFETETAMNTLRVHHDYFNKGYIPQDAATSDTSYGHGENTWFVRKETQGPYDYGDYMLSTVAKKELVSRPITKPLKSVAQAQMANFVISTNSKHKEEAMQFLNLVNTNEEVLNTLIHGIEGEHWEKLDNNRIKKIEQGNQMSPWNTGNNEIVYVEEVITDEMIEERDEKIANAVESPILGFNFQTDDVITEITAIGSVLEKYADGLHTGTLNPDEVMDKFIQELKDAGLDTVQEEAQKQYDEWRAEQ